MSINNHTSSSAITQDEINAILWKACDTFQLLIEQEAANAQTPLA